MGGRNGTTGNKGKQESHWLEKYQIEDIVNGIKVTRTRYRLRTGDKRNKKKK